jgi:DNA-directed RNA polymerase specialized sigma24 family protein
MNAGGRREMLRETLKRKARAEYLRRLENSARTLEEYQEVVDMHDKIDAAREKREQRHEVGRFESLYQIEIPANNKHDYPVKLSYRGGAVVPRPIQHPCCWELMKGDFISYIYDNADEMWQIIEDWQVAKPLRDALTAKQKEALFLSAVRLATTEQIGCYTDKSDRAVRRLIADALEKIRSEFAPKIRYRLENDSLVTPEKQRFYEWYIKQNPPGKTPDGQ